MHALAAVLPIIAGLWLGAAAIVVVLFRLGARAAAGRRERGSQSVQPLFQLLAALAVMLRLLEASDPLLERLVPWLWLMPVALPALRSLVARHRRPREAAAVYSLVRVRGQRSRTSR